MGTGHSWSRTQYLESVALEPTDTPGKGGCLQEEPQSVTQPFRDNFHSLPVPVTRDGAWHFGEGAVNRLSSPTSIQYQQMHNMRPSWPPRDHTQQRRLYEDVRHLAPLMAVSLPISVKDLAEVTLETHVHVPS